MTGFINRIIEWFKREYKDDNRRFTMNDYAKFIRQQMENDILTDSMAFWEWEETKYFVDMTDIINVLGYNVTTWTDDQCLEFLQIRRGRRMELKRTKEFHDKYSATEHQNMKHINDK